MDTFDTRWADQLQQQRRNRAARYRRAMRITTGRVIFNIIGLAVFSGLGLGVGYWLLHLIK